MIGPCRRIAADGETGECFVDLGDIHTFSGDIARLVGDFEVECFVFFHSDAAAGVPCFPVKAVFDEGIFFTACGAQSHIFVGPIFRIAGNGEAGENFVDPGDIHTFSGDIARLVGGSEVECLVFFHSDAAAGVPCFPVKAVFDEGIFFIACGIEHHIGVGPLWGIS